MLKYRYDYFPVRQSASYFGMSPVLHESVSSKVVEEILDQLKSIASYEDTSAKF